MHVTHSWIPQVLQALEEQPPRSPRVPTHTSPRADHHAAPTPGIPIPRHARQRPGAPAPRLPKDNLTTPEEEMMHRENLDFEKYVQVMVENDQVSREPWESLLTSRQAKHLPVRSLSRSAAVAPMRATGWMSMKHQWTQATM